MSTIERALGLLEHFSGASPEIGLSDFKQRTHFDKATLHRYLASLKDCGFVEQNPSTKAYRLGPALIRLSAVREKTVPLRKIVQSHVDRIAEEIHELVHASVPQPSGMSMLCVADGGISGTRVALDEAEVLPYYATSSGVAQLAFGSHELRATVLAGGIRKFTDHTPTSHDKVKRLIAEALNLGAAFMDETYETDVSSVAVPFFDNTALSIGTIAIATPSARMTPHMRDTITSTLIRNSLELTDRLGGKIPSALSAIWTAAEGKPKARSR